MIDAVNNPLEEIAKKRAAEAARVASEKKALGMTPDLKNQLGDLITTHITPEEQIRDARQYHGDYNRNYFDDDKFKTHLIASIPMEDGNPTKVTIYSTRYPKFLDEKTQEEIDYRQETDYKIEVEELDRVLIIAKQAITLQSKEWGHEPFTPHTRIGVPLHSWPSWQRPALVEDINGYRALLLALNRRGVTFEGTTPPIVKYIQTEPVNPRTLKPLNK